MLWPLFSLVVLIVGSLLGLAQWAAWLSGRYGAPRWLRALTWVFGVAAFAQLALHYWAYRGISGALDHEGNVDPASRARLLAEGISEAMNGGAIGILFALLSALVMLVLTWRYHWSAKVPKPVGTPPYR